MPLAANWPGKCATAPGSPSATPHSARPYQLNRCMHDAGIGFRSGVRDVRGRYWKDRLGAARAARIKGWSVDEVSSRIKFSARQIEALENEQWADLPSGVSLRGLIRNYARLLGARTRRPSSSRSIPGTRHRAGQAQPGALHSAHSIPSPGPTTSVPRRRPGLADRHRAGAGRRRGYAFWQGWLPQHWLAFDWLPSCPSKPGFPDARILSALPGCAASRCGSRAAAPRVQWT